MATEITVDHLPDEVLQIVLSKLSVRERKNAKLVNNRWLAVCSSQSLSKYELVNLLYKDFHLLKIPRCYLNLYVHDDFMNARNAFVPDFDVKQQQNEFWVNNGNSMRSLTMEYSRNHYPMLTKIMKHCRNLKDLSLLFTETTGLDNNIDNSGNEEEEAEDDGPTNLDFLTSFNLSGSYSLEFILGRPFSKFSRSVPNLKRLELVFVSESSDACTTSMGLLPLISQSRNLTELVFYEYQLPDDTFFVNVFEHMGPQLTCLRLAILTLNSIDCLTRHSDKFSNLKNLELDEITFTKSDSLSGLSKFKSLEFISFARINLCDEDLLSFDGLSNLKGLGLVDTVCSPRGIVNFFRSKVRPNLIAVQLEEVTDFVLMGILDYLPNLKFLELFGSEITLKVAQLIITNCKQLTNLSLTCCNLEDSFELDILNGLVNLVDLNLFHTQIVEPRLIGNFSFGKLITLHLVDETLLLSEELIKKFLKNCPKLSCVYMDPTLRGSMEDFDIVQSTNIISFTPCGARTFPEFIASDCLL